MSLGAAAAAWALVLVCLAAEVDALATGVFLCGARGPLWPALATSSSGLCFLRSTARLAHPGWRRASLALRLKMSDDSKDSHADGKAKAGAEADDDFSGLDDSQRKFKAAGECAVKWPKLSAYLISSLSWAWGHGVSDNLTGVGLDVGGLILSVMLTRWP